MHSNREETVDNVSPVASRTAYTYSILQVVPDPVRGEFVNIGVAMVDDDEQYAKLLFNYRIQSRLAAVGGAHLVEPVLAELSDVVAAYDVAGAQVRREVRTQPTVTKALLDDWVRNRGGVVRLSSPRVVLADDPDVAFDSIYRRYVRAPSRPAEERRSTPEGERSELRNRFIRALSRLRNFDSARVSIGGAVRGERAHHWLDVAIVGVEKKGDLSHQIALPSCPARLRPYFTAWRDVAR